MGEEIEVSPERAQMIVAAGAGVIVADDPAPIADGLDDMTVAELRGLAEERGIDLGDARRKGDIIEAIRQAQRG